MAIRRVRGIDLFCGPGLAAEGYNRAGCEMWGFDIEPQPHYPDVFIQADLSTAVIEDGWLRVAGHNINLRTFDFIHASPPCQLYSSLRTSILRTRKHPDLVARFEALLSTSGLPWVLENVPGAPVSNPFVLCGSMFGLGAMCADGRWRQLRRHRLFSSSHLILLPGHCSHRGQALGVYGHGRWTPTRDGRRGGYQGSSDEKRAAMGVTHWVNGHEVSQGIPPAYTEWIARQLVPAEVAA